MKPIPGILLAAAFTIIASTAFGQRDSRLDARFNDRQIEQMRQQHPSMLDYWNYYLDHAYTIEEIPQGKASSLEHSIQINDLNAFNILEHDIHMARNGAKYFRIEGTHKMLRLLSNSEFTDKFNDQRTHQR